MNMSATIKSAHNVHEIKVQTEGSVKEVRLAPKPTGFGSSVNGGELLLLSLATCFCNDLYREAANLQIPVTGVEVVFTGEFGGPGDPGTNFRYNATVVSDAPTEQIAALIQHTDKVAEVHNTLRKGLVITLQTTV